MLKNYKWKYTELKKKCTQRNCIRATELSVLKWFDELYVNDNISAPITNTDLLNAHFKLFIWQHLKKPILEFM